MTTKSEKILLNNIKEKHFLKWGAKFGKRKCSYEIADSCLGTSNEYDKHDNLQWRGKMCIECLKFRQKGYRDIRQLTHIPRKIGRPVGSKGKKKKEVESDSD
jgi:hypothetical protein